VKNSYDAIILGAGAAGLMCAIEAGKRGRRVAVLDHAERIGKKILISGGGRCNFTNIHCRPENFLSANPHFCKSPLSRYTPVDFVKLVEKHRIAYHEKTLGQLFCDRTAQDILGMLEEECKRAGVRILPHTRVTEILRSDRFVLRTKDDEFHAAALVVATGGLSIPKMGATAFGYEVAKKFGIGIVETRPALVPLTFGSEDAKKYKDLAGVSAEVVASLGTTPPSRIREKGRTHNSNHSRFREKMLFTHRGLSGPAILQISSYWKQGDAVAMDLAPSRDVMGGMLQSSAGRDLATAKAALHQVLPARFAERWLEHHAPAKWTNQGIEELEKAVHRWEVTPDGTEGYEKAEVTAGGVDTDELSSKTMESKKVPGLYFIGEVVDVTGHLGGFNFQWAWASGFSAGQAL
jgi:predicted Rossmann fold flavoprotein